MDYSKFWGGIGLVYFLLIELVNDLTNKTHGIGILAFLMCIIISLYYDWRDFKWKCKQY